MVVALVSAAVVFAWAYQNQVWLRDDYSAGYEYGASAEWPSITARDSLLTEDNSGSCQEHAEAHSNSVPAQVVFRGGCEDAKNGRNPRPEAAGGFVSDALGLWGPFG